MEPNLNNEELDEFQQEDTDSECRQQLTPEEIKELELEDPPKVGVTSFKILLYVPNQIDYLRYVLVFQGMKFAFVEDKWAHFMFFYYVAIAMDVIDGAFARVLDQTSRFGQCLDMICDRASVSMMYIVLGQVYPKLEFFLIACFIVDYGAHFLQFMSNAIIKNTSHKCMTGSEGWLVKLYYTNKFFFVLMACGADNGLVYAFLYGRYHELKDSLKFNIAMVFFCSIILVKQMINIGQWIGSVEKLLQYDKEQKINASRIRQNQKLNRIMDNIKQSNQKTQQPATQ